MRRIRTPRIPRRQGNQVYLGGKEARGKENSDNATCIQHRRSPRYSWGHWKHVTRDGPCSRFLLRPLLAGQGRVEGWVQDSGRAWAGLVSRLPLSEKEWKDLRSDDGTWVEYMKPCGETHKSFCACVDIQQVHVCGHICGHICGHVCAHECAYTCINVRVHVD